MTDQKNAQAEERPQGLSEVLATIRPQADIELGRELSKLIDAVVETGKAGSLTYRIDVKMVDSGGTAVVVGDRITSKRPEKNRPTSMAYIGTGNRLQRTDPQSMPLFEDEDDLRTADGAADPRTGEIRKVQD